MITLAALLQALLWGFGGAPIAAVLSGLVITLALAVSAAWVAGGSVETFRGPGLVLTLWSLGGVLVVSTLLVALPMVAPVIAAILPATLMTVAARRPWRDLGWIWRRAPLRTAVWLLLTIVICAAIWLLSVVLGLVGAGVVGAFAWWVLFGIVQLRLLRVWRGVLRRAH
ncbi:hypothetical protein G7066_04150 [Leucobacter coleopterorum]|uniref:Uncharacterized protein n=1 Tax=Leucobacter coleopterorum TaxID=2714933 RepID=A0ABX6JYL6_9MICO|nr:hypothetical protein [Leucobacter coleopterorum]QIM18052.1 hypothetical protein G7066_04150 [Leucobacter coleopterorum]